MRPAPAMRRGRRRSYWNAELGTLEAIGVILLFVIALGVLNRIEFGSFD